MTCGEFRHSFEAYVDGSASNGANASVEAHAAECSDCERALLEGLDLGADAEALLCELAPRPAESVFASIEALLPPQPSTQSDACYLMAPDLSALLDGALASEDAECVRAHLDDCAACARDYRAYMSVDAALLRNRAEPSLRLAKRMRSLTAKYRTEERSKRRAPRTWLAPWLVPTGALAAAGLCLFMLGVHVGAGQRPGPMSPAPVIVRAGPATGPVDLAPSGSPGSGHPIVPGTSLAYETSEAPADVQPVVYSPSPRRAHYAPRRSVNVGRYSGGAPAPVVHAETGPSGAVGASDAAGASAAGTPEAGIERRSRLGLDMRALDHLVVIPTASGPPDASHSVTVSEPAFEVVEAETVHLSSNSGDDEPFEPSGPARLY